MSANTNRSPDGAAARADAPNWGVGRYENVAAALLPASRVVVDTAAIQPAERVLDLGCGTGNVARLAAAHSSQVIGIDPATRLLEVARARATADGDGTTRFLEGRAEDLPLGDADIDVALAVFSLIFANDAKAAAAELSRVLTPHGRIVMTAWLPSGTIFRYTSLAEETVRRVLAAPPPSAPFRWEDREALTGLLAPHGFSVHLTEHSLAFTGESPEAFLDNQARNHPLAVMGLSILEKTGGAAALRERLLEILREGNEDPQAFRATSRYIVAQARR